MRNQSGKILYTAAAIVAAMAFSGPGLVAQKQTPADTAAKFSGVWKLNRELSPGLAPVGTGRGGRGGAAPGGAPAKAILVKPTMGQGGGFGGGGGGSTADVAGAAAMKALQMVPELLTIRATADSVTFVDARGERTYPVTDKNVKMEMNGAQITAKSKWDKDTLKQDFAYGETNLSSTWELSPDGKRASFHVKVANMSQQNARFTEVKAVFDKQP